MPVRPTVLRAGIAAVLGGALALGFVAPANAAPQTSTVVSHEAAAKAVRTKVTASPKSVSVIAGKRAKFSVSAKGSKLSYQWYVRKPGKSSYAKVAGAKTRTYGVTAMSRIDGARYRVVVKGAKGTVTSKSAALVVVSKPKIVTDPADRQARSGDKVTFSVKAVGHGLTYTWRIASMESLDWQTLPGTGRSVTLTARSALNGSLVEVVVKNKAGKTESLPAFLDVASTASDPYTPGTMGVAGEWALAVEHSDLDADAEVAAASPANPAAPAGSTYVTTTVVACNFSDEGTPDPATIRLRGTDGAFYTTTGVTLPPVPAAMAKKYSDAAEFGCSLSTVGALAPDSVIAGAVWAATGPATRYTPASTSYWAATAA